MEVPHPIAAEPAALQLPGNKMNPTVIVGWLLEKLRTNAFGWVHAPAHITDAHMHQPRARTMALRLQALNLQAAPGPSGMRNSVIRAISDAHGGFQALSAYVAMWKAAKISQFTATPRIAAWVAGATARILSQRHRKQ